MLCYDRSMTWRIKVSMCWSGLEWKKKTAIVKTALITSCSDNIFCLIQSRHYVNELPADDTIVIWVLLYHHLRVQSVECVGISLVAASAATLMALQLRNKKRRKKNRIRHERPSSPLYVHMGYFFFQWQSCQLGSKWISVSYLISELKWRECFLGRVN